MENNYAETRKLSYSPFPLPCGFINGRRVGGAECMDCRHNIMTDLDEQTVDCGNLGVWGLLQCTEEATETPRPETGAPKNNKQENKPQLSLIPLDLLDGLARAYEYGCHKYSRNSWRKGFPQSDMVDAALRHIDKYWNQGKDLDKEALEAGFVVDHLSMAIFNILCVIDAHRNHPQFCDRYLPDVQKDEPPFVYINND